MKLLNQLLLVTILFCLTITTAFAQGNGTLKGKVRTSDNQPAENITVALKGTRFGTTTNDDGEFSIKAPAGSYTLVVSLVGATGVEQSVTITASKTQTLPAITIGSNVSQLKAISITGSKNKLAVKKSAYVAKLPLNNLENPQSYTTISKELLEEQINISFNDALRNASGLDKLWSSTGRAGDGAAYYSLRGFTIQTTMINGIAGVTNGDLDPSNIERIEVIKGPSGTLFGGALTNFGGLINITTKRPIDTVGGSVSYTTGNFGLSRLTADIYGPVSKDQKLIARVNAAYNYQNSFQDAGFHRSFFVAPSIIYRPTDKFTLNLDADFYSYEGTNPLMVFLNRSRQLIARTPDQLNFDFKRSYTNNDVTIKTPNVNVRGLATYKMGAGWTSQTSFASSNRKTDGINQYVMYIGATDDLLNRYTGIQNSSTNLTNLQQNFIGDFSIFGKRNRLVAGVDFLTQITNNDNAPYFLYDQVSSVNPADANYSKISRYSIMAKAAASTAAGTYNRSQSNVYSAYVSDVFNITDRLLASAGLRLDVFESRGSYNLTNGVTTGLYKQVAFSPKFGLVYQVVKDQVSLFGNYMNGFRNVAPVVQPLPEYSGILEPQQAKQFEGGVKLDAFEGKLTATASYYDIKVTNMTRSIQVTQNGSPFNVTIQDGTQKSKGFELDVIANPVQGLNIVANYSHNDSKMLQSAASILGRRPVSAGPANLINYWMSYTFFHGPLANFGAGAGANFASDNYITNTVETGPFVLPSYTLFNATVFHNTKKYRIGVKVDNLLNKTYYKGWTTIEPQQPRSIVANVTYKF